MTALTWLGIAFCISQSAIFSGLNLAFFSISRLLLEIESDKGNRSAEKVLKLRRDSNFLLATILWGNVGINVMLALLSNSVMAGVIAFLFSTFLITIFGEILPQAYFSRNAMQMAAALSPVIRFYQFALYPMAKPTALVLDAWLGEESIQFMREKDIRQLIHRHIDSSDSDVDAVEGFGALNFLAIDDTHVSQEGEPVAPESIIKLPFADGRPVFARGPEGASDRYDSFIEMIAPTRYRWVILVDDSDMPAWTIDSYAFLRAATHEPEGTVDPCQYCHQPIVVTDPKTRLGAVLTRLKEGQPAQSDAPMPHRIILLWDSERRIITSSDIMGRLFKGIGQFSDLQSRIKPGHSMHVPWHHHDNA